ncbi:helix-turn-helix domain-containing protein [Paenibacillus stellifer]|uniref:helix-turn-helix domain-containing protein n=1 Tax=Paenibacillus stellifer TaxID=169760 RepID=UPI0009FEBB1D
MENRGIDARLLSQITGVSTSTVERWIEGKFEPRHKNLMRIADALNISTDYLTGRT